MTAFQIKIIAIITMIIDHLGLFFFPQFVVFRMIGRLSFPLFAWLIANGARHTHNGNAYLLRLGMFSIVAQVPFLLANRLIDPTFSQLNVLFTLSFGLAAIQFIKMTKNRPLWVLITALAAVPAQIFQSDYGAFGVFMIVAFYLFFNNFKYLVIAQSLIFFVQFICLLGFQTGAAEPLGLFSLLFIALYNNQPGPKAKYLFYLFYPLQYVVFYFLVRRLL